MKVLILVNHDLVVYNFRKELVQELIDLGFEVTISSPNGNRINKLTKMGVEHKNIKIDRHGFNPISEIKLLYQYLKQIDEVQPDIVLSYTIKPNLYGSIAARIKNVPIIANITGLGNAFNNGGLKSLLILNLYKLSFRKTNKIYFQNLENMEYLQKYLNIGARSALLPGSGVNLQEFSYSSYPNNIDTVITYFGRIMETKGIIELLDAIDILNLSLHNVRYQFVGFFESEEIKAKFFERKKKHSNIIYYEHLEDIKPILIKSNAVILPSYHEGMSNSLLEAAALGRPLLATDISGCREIIENNENGFLFKVADVNSIVETVKKFAKTSLEQKRIMGKKSRTKVEKEFDRKIVVDEYISAIDKILGGK